MSRNEGKDASYISNFHETYTMEENARIFIDLQMPNGVECSAELAQGADGVSRPQT